MLLIGTKGSTSKESFVFASDIAGKGFEELLEPVQDGGDEKAQAGAEGSDDG